MASSSVASSTWTAKQNKSFERALAIFDRESPDRWERVASMVGGGKSAADVKFHYELLEQDVHLIESGHIPFPNYRTTTSSSANNSIINNNATRTTTKVVATATATVTAFNDEDHRHLMYLKLR